MDSGIYSAATGLQGSLQAQDVTSHNLANVNTPGYKRRLAVFQPFQAQLAAQAGPLAGTELNGVVVDYTRGPMQQTGNRLDLALNCDGFFVLRGAEGQVYTRQGAFTLSQEGNIVDSVGRPLLSTGGSEIRIPTITREIRVNQDGSVLADGASVGRISVVDVPAPRALVPAAYTAFALAPGAPAPEPVAHPTVAQGALEGSNANAVEEMVSMITTLRGFEASQRVLRSIDENLDRLNQTASK